MSSAWPLHSAGMVGSAAPQAYDNAVGTFCIAMIGGVDTLVLGVLSRDGIRSSSRLPQDEVQRSDMSFIELLISRRKTAMLVEL